MDEFSKAKAAGQLMLQRISQDDNTQVDYPAQSIFDRPESREENGWQIYTHRIEITSAFHILEQIKKITGSNFEKNWMGVLTKYVEKADSTLGQTNECLDAHYYYVINTKDGIIIATKSKSPYFLRRANAIAAGEPLENISTTTLQTWSDVTYLSWYGECTRLSTPLRNLNHIIQSHITNSETRSVIKDILEEEKIIFPPDGLTIDINDAKGYGAALLGTPNGKGIGWLLAQHKNQLGNSKIVSVEIFHSLQVGSDDCNEDTGERKKNRRGIQDPLDYLNLDFTIRCG